MAAQIGRAFLLAALTILALGLGTMIARAQQPGPTFVYHGDVTTERQAEIAAEYEAVAAWFDEQYGYRLSSFTIQIGATASALTDVLRSAGQDVPGGVGPCFWLGQYGFLLVDGCENPLPFARVHVTAAAYELSRNSTAVVEQGHFSAGPAWLVHGAEEFGQAAYQADTGQTSLDDQRQRRMDQVRGFTIELDQLEVTTNFWGVPQNRSIGWMAVDQLTQIAGADSYIEFFRQRSMHSDWQDAFRSAFGLEVDAFYKQFPEYVAELKDTSTEAVAKEWRDRWWQDSKESGRTVEVPIVQGGQYLNWYGIDTPVSQFLEWYPSVALLAQWSADDARYMGAIRSLPSTVATAPDISRNTIVWISVDSRSTQALQLPAPVHDRVSVHAGGNFVPWLGDSETPIAEAEQAIDGLMITLIQDTEHSTTRFVGVDDDEQLLHRGDVLWVVSPTSARWIQSSPRGQPVNAAAAVTVEETLALLENAEIAEIAETEFTIAAVAGTVDPQDLEVIKARLADGIAFFRERFDTPVFEFEVRVHGPEITDGVPCGSGGGRIDVYLWCRDWTISGLSTQPSGTEMMVHEYFHLLQGHWNPNFSYLDGQRTPAWLVEGSAFYSEGVYWDHRRFSIADDRHTLRLQESGGVPDTLKSLAEEWDTESGLPIYSLAYTAVHWLVEHSANHDSWLEFWYPWNGRDRWELFEEVFGITLDEFYEEFEEWRAENYPLR